MKFKEVKIGQWFDFIGPNPALVSFWLPVKKIGARHYEDAEQNLYKVGSVNVGVYHVKTMLRKAMFQIEGMPRAYEGFTDGSNWNGWATPVFARKVAEEIARDWPTMFKDWPQGSEMVSSHIDDKEIRLFEPDSGEWDIYPVLENGYYPIGTNGMTWEEVTGIHLVVAELIARGYETNLEFQDCIHIALPSGEHIWFGTANETWSGDSYANADALEEGDMQGGYSTTLSSEILDAKQVADAFEAALKQGMEAIGLDPVEYRGADYGDDTDDTKTQEEQERDTFLRKLQAFETAAVELEEVWIELGLDYYPFKRSFDEVVYLITRYRQRVETEMKRGEKV